MQRVTVSLDEDQALQFDETCQRLGYRSRSEAVRDIVRDMVESRRLAEHPDAQCVASFSFVYDHHVRTLAQRLVEIGHEHHELVVSTTHVHLDHDTCLETMILKGRAAAVRAFADGIQAERGVRHGVVNLITVTPNDHHAAAQAHGHKGHGHLTPRS